MKRLAQIALDSAYAADRMDDYRRISDTVDDRVRAPKAQIDELRVSQTTQRVQLDRVDNDLQNTMTALQNLEADLSLLRRQTDASKSLRDAQIRDLRKNVKANMRVLQRDINTLTADLSNQIVVVRRDVEARMDGLRTDITETQQSLKALELHREDTDAGITKLAKTVTSVLSDMEELDVKVDNAARFAQTADAQQAENAEAIRAFGKTVEDAKNELGEAYLAKMAELEANLSEVQALKARQGVLASQFVTLQALPRTSGS